MAVLSDRYLLVKVKYGLGIVGDYHDNTLNAYIDEVKAYMAGAGIHETIVNSDKAVGCIIRGVQDLWNNGEGKLSPYFEMRVVQLANEPAEAPAEVP